MNRKHTTKKAENRIINAKILRKELRKDLGRDDRIILKPTAEKKDGRVWILLMLHRIKKSGVVLQTWYKLWGCIKCQNLLSTDQLSAFQGLSSTELPGFKVCSNKSISIKLLFSFTFLNLQFISSSRILLPPCFFVTTNIHSS
jgi:hypothetical protein